MRQAVFGKPTPSVPPPRASHAIGGDQIAKLRCLASIAAATSTDANRL
jgi:hypothetical protein